MGEVISEEESLESLLSFCMHCGQYSRNSEFWIRVCLSCESIFSVEGVLSAIKECCDEDSIFSHTLPESAAEHVVGGKEKPPKQKLEGYFFIVNNRGYLFGDYDNKQRL